MRPEDLEKAKQLVSQSKILSTSEKADWLDLLPSMNDRQVAELMKILGEPVWSAPKQWAPAPLPPQMPVPRLRPTEKPQAPPPFVMPKIDIKQKEIPTSIPFYEKELPEHATASQLHPASQTV